MLKGTLERQSRNRKTNVLKKKNDNLSWGKKRKGGKRQRDQQTEKKMKSFHLRWASHLPNMGTVFASLYQVINFKIFPNTYRILSESILSFVYIIESLVVEIRNVVEYKAHIWLEQEWQYLSTVPRWVVSIIVFSFVVFIFLPCLFLSGHTLSSLRNLLIN